MLTVGFHQPHLCLRGTTVAMYDYAYYNQEILGNKSVVFYCEDLPDDFPQNDPSVIEKFRNSGIDLCAVNTAETHPGADELNAAIKKLGIQSKIYFHDYSNIFIVSNALPIRLPYSQLVKPLDTQEPN